MEMTGNHHGDDNHHKTTPNHKQASGMSNNNNYEYNMSCFQPPMPQMNGSAKHAKNRSQIKERLVSLSSNDAAPAASTGDHHQQEGHHGATTTGTAAGATGTNTFFLPRSTAAMALSSISEQQEQQKQELTDNPDPSIPRNIHADDEQEEESSSLSEQKAATETARPVSQCSAETQLTCNNSSARTRVNDPHRSPTSPYPPPPPPPPPHVPVVSSVSLQSVESTPQQPTSPYPHYTNNDCPPPRSSAAVVVGVTPSPHAAQSSSSSSSHMSYYNPTSEQQHSDYYQGPPPQYHHHSRHDPYQQQYHHHHQSVDPYQSSGHRHTYHHHEQQYQQQPLPSSRHEQHSVRWWGSTSSSTTSEYGSEYSHRAHHHSPGGHHESHNNRSNGHHAHDPYHGHHHTAELPPPPPPPPPPPHHGNTSHPHRLSLGHPALGVGAGSNHGNRAPASSSHRHQHQPSSYDYHQQHDVAQHHHYYGHSIQQTTTTHNPRVRSLSHHSMTGSMQPRPTKKSKTSTVAPDYSRKKKSLGVLAETFCSRHDGCRKETEIVVDTLAKELGVERRRIYDVVNIFEAVRLVVKKGKNTYSWMGTEHLPHMFALLQQEAIFDYPQDAFDGDIIDTLPTKEQINVARLAFRDPKRDAKSLSRLSQQFLQVFLVASTGTCVSLIDASDKIQGGASTQQELAALGSQGRAIPDDPILIQKAAARGLKTKIRRLYDIANVFHAIGLLEKVDETEHKLISGDTLEGRRPFYRWAFKISTKDLRSVYGNMSQEMKESRCPFSPEPLAVPIKMEQAERQTPRGGSYTSTFSSNKSSMLPPPPTSYSVQSKEDDGGGVLPTPPRVLARASVHGSADKKHQEDHAIVAVNSSYNITMNDKSNSMNQHGNRRVSLPMTTTSSQQHGTPGNCMAARPHSVTPPSTSNHVNHSSPSIADETLGAPPIEDDPITLSGGGNHNSNNYGASTHHVHHHHHRVSLPETM